MGLPLEFRDRIQARSGMIVVERLERHASGYIIIPDEARSSFRSSEAVVRKVGSGVVEYSPGDILMLGAGVGKKIRFGERDEVVWEMWNPATVMAVTGRVEPGESVGADLDHPRITKPRSHALRGTLPEDTVVPEDATVVDEGDDRGIV